jgi:long-subunit fatty acid transport protein
MGFSVGISNLEYDYSYSHKESFTDIYDEYISFEYINDLNIDGRGYDFNIGVIYRPVPFLRIGAAFHTPTYYFIEESYNPILYSGDPRAENPIYPYDYDGQILIGRDDYTMKTPMKINGGLAVQFGKRAIVSADIDYVNYSKMEYRNSPASSDLNLDITNNLDEVINLRFGGEAKFGILALRGGYGYYGSPIEAYDYSRQLFSGGVGFNFGKMYVDLTGMYTMHYSENVVIPLFAGDTYVKTNKTQTIILSTIGFKF